MTTRLDASAILTTARRLRARIEERFPGSGLGRVAADLETVAGGAGQAADAIGRPHAALRLVAWLLSGAIVAVLVALVLRTSGADGVEDLATFLQTLEAGLGSMVFIGAAILFVITYEQRIARRLVLRRIDELRSLAHVVDMHQLTKSPEKVLLPGPDTESSRREHLTPFLLSRYLDYCSEMLSLLSKIGALYVRDSNDPVCLTAADQIESLTSGLARKIWQKIMLLGALPPAPSPPD